MRRRRTSHTCANYSAWTPLLSATPWALAPQTWTPAPNGRGTNAIEIGFDTPLNPDTLTTALTVKDAGGTPVPGTASMLVDFASQDVVGVGFLPSKPVGGRLTATLKGGPSGIKTEDGRTMGADYSWSFSLGYVYLPQVIK